MNKGDYPTEEELQRIKEWDYNDFTGLMDFIYNIWNYADCGYWAQTENMYEISTGGWSGNEDIIQAMKENTMFWMMCWGMSRRGGHYLFEVPQMK